MRSNSWIKAGVSLSVMMWAGHAAAQDVAKPKAPEATDKVDSTVVVVTANRRSETLQNTAMSVNVTTGEDIKALGLLDTKDLQKVVPGLELTNTTGRNNTITLRGIGFDPDSGTGPTVQVYLNEVPVSSQSAFVSLFDIGQVEVLRGPQGLLRGLSSPGGAITFSTKRPNFRSVDAYIQGTATDRGGYNAQFGANLPINDQFAIRFAGVHDQNRGNQVKDVTNGERSRFDTDSARVTLGWRPNADFKAFLTYQYVLSQGSQINQVYGPGNTPVAVPFGDMTRSGPPIAVGDYEGVVDGPNRLKNLSQFWNLNLNWDLATTNLAVIAGYQSSKLSYLNDADSANAVPGYVSVQNVFTPSDVKTLEVRWSSKDEGALNWNLGAFYQKSTGTTVSKSQADTFFGTYPISYGLFLPVNAQATVPSDSEVLSFNAGGRYKFGQFTLEGGLRYTISKSLREATIVVTSPGYAAFAIPAFTQTIQGVPTELRNQEDHPITGGVTLTWQPSTTMTLYGSYGRSFRSGSVGISAPAGISNDLIATHGEITDSLEAGIKGSVLDRRLHYTADVFYQKIDGFLTRLPLIQYNCREIFTQCNSAGPAINNATEAPNGTFDFNYNGNATVKGVEGTIDAKLTDYWTLKINASYAQARWDRGALLPCNDYAGTGIPNATGAPHITGAGNVSFCQYKRLSASPDFSLTGSSEIRLPAQGDVKPFLRGLATYKPAVYQERSDFRLPSTLLIDLFAGVRLKQSSWEITAFVKNVLDERKITNMPSAGEYTWGTETPGVVYRSGYRMINATMPREFGITSSYRF